MPLAEAQEAAIQTSHFKAVGNEVWRESVGERPKSEKGLFQLSARPGARTSWIRRRDLLPCFGLRARWGLRLCVSMR
jgi:hypothetical protein